MKFYLVINSKLLISTVVFLLILAECEIFYAYEYENDNSSWHFHINQQRKYHAQLSMKKVLLPRGQGSIPMHLLSYLCLGYLPLHYVVITRAAVQGVTLHIPADTIYSICVPIRLKKRNIPSLLQWSFMVCRHESLGYAEKLVKKTHISFSLFLWP